MSTSAQSRKLAAFRRASLAVWGEERFSCKLLSIKSLAIVDCCSSFAKFNQPVKRDVRNGVGQRARTGSPCTGCAIGSAHAAGERP